MTLTVRLDATLAAALERYCAERGATKSLVVQESLAAYLLAGGAATKASTPAAAGRGSAASAQHKAFADLGLIGALAGPGVPATKAGLRRRVAEQQGRRASPVRKAAGA